MKVVRDPGTVDASEMPASVVALGTFDGVHLGHQEILGRCVAHARGTGARAVAFTFDRHPLHVVRPHLAPPQLTDIEDRLALIEAAGIDVAVVAHFDEAFARATPEEFVREVLVDGLRATRAVAGFNYTFGWRARGTADVLMDLGKKCGFDVDVVEPVTVGGVPVGSTEIRARLSRGDVAGARAMLGRPFSVKGTVVPGHGRGRTIGYPTANVEVGPGMAVPGRGVYAVVARVRGMELRAVANVGVRPTFEGRSLGLEVFAIDFTGDVYGEAIRVFFVERLRDERKFSSSVALASQIAEDVRCARRVLVSWCSGHTKGSGPIAPRCEGPAVHSGDEVGCIFP
ncbi:MAG: bifunctional riboflavin kinase/FAD synthetase [Bacteroidota bacterium]